MGSRCKFMILTITSGTVPISGKMSSKSKSHRLQWIVARQNHIWSKRKTANSNSSLPWKSRILHPGANNNNQWVSLSLDLSSRTTRLFNPESQLSRWSSQRGPQVRPNRWSMLADKLSEPKSKVYRRPMS